MALSPEEKLAGALGGSLEGAVAGKIASFGGLLSRDAAIRILCQENGISTEEKIPLSSARASLLPFSFSARVDRVFPVQKYGGAMRSVRLHVSDAGGEATLVLWNEQVGLAVPSVLAGDGVECSGAYFRAGEISIGRNGSLRRQGGAGASSVASLKPGICNVEGTVEKAEGVRTYSDRRTGEAKKMLQFTLCSGGACCRAVWWSPPEGAQLPREGDEVAVGNADFRAGELHLGRFSGLAVKGNAGASAMHGVFMGASSDAGTAHISIGKEKFTMPLNDALALLGIAPAPRGVDSSVLLRIKSGALEGKRVRFAKEEGRLALIEPESQGQDG